MLSKKYDWPVVGFLLGVPLVAAVAVPVYLYYIGWNWITWVFALVFAFATNMSITAGYHRLFSHRSYEAHRIMRWLYVFVGASAWQGSVIRWCASHRVHHRHVDTEQDPYNINQGFWYAHMGWMFLADPKGTVYRAPDLERDPVIRFQDRYYIPVAIFMGFIFPMIVGALYGDPLGGLLVAGCLRIAVTQQSTYFINSLCHTLGGRPYSHDITARDSFLVALLTHGEGYHNFHHRFEGDYRNGIRWWQWDPTKWMIWSLSKVKLTSRLRRMSNEEILKARLQVESLRLRAKGLPQERLEHLKEQILAAALRLRALKNEYQTVSRERLAQLKTEIELTRLEFQYALKQWKAYLRSPVSLQL